MEFLRRQAPRAAALVLTIRIPRFRNFEPESDLPGTRSKTERLLSAADLASMTCCRCRATFSSSKSVCAIHDIQEHKEYRCQGILPPVLEIQFLVNSTSSPLAASTIETHPHRNYVMQWNFNVQRQLMSDTTLTVGYVGSRGIHLFNARKTTAI